MSSATIQTVVGMIENLPEASRRVVVERLREIIEELEDERRWDEAFARTQPQLIAAARRAKQEIAAGQAQPLDPFKLHHKNSV